MSGFPSAEEPKLKRGMQLPALEKPLAGRGPVQQQPVDSSVAQVEELAVSSAAEVEVLVAVSLQMVWCPSGHVRLSLGLLFSYQPALL